MTRYFRTRTSYFFLASQRYDCACPAHFLPSAPLHQFAFVNTALFALFTDYVDDPLAQSTEFGLPQLAILHFAHDRMDEFAGA
jgi:hypothetical protein